MKVFIAHSVRDRELVVTLVNLLREDGHEVFVASEIAAPANVLSVISSAIRSADVLVAIVTASNPNVFYELGLAAGASVPILVTAPANERLPVDLASVPYVQLTGDLLRDAQTIARRTRDLQGIASTKPEKFESAEAALRAATQDPAVLESLSPGDFEGLVTRLFKDRGYEVTTTPFMHDTGADFVIESPKSKELVLVEVKKLSRQSRVSVETVRRLLSAVSTAHAPLGLLVATSGYTAAAIALAAGTPILLRTLEEILAAKSEKELLERKTDGA
jgi:HJR/Mrr/RecB family endonuclease